ncbi:MAG: hypothetical protein ACJ76J_24310 [Thermoanaerobaculia bacterium]
MKPRREESTAEDARLDNLLPLVKALPVEQRRNLAGFIEALLDAHRILKAEAARRRKPKKT